MNTDMKKTKVTNLLSMAARARRIERSLSCEIPAEIYERLESRLRNG